ncbi:MAG: hypothetical protein AAFO81_01980 [Pseudomonadota bacterium]
MTDTTHHKDDNVTELLAPRREISFRWRLGHYHLRYDDALLQIDWTVGGRCRRTKHDLLLLNPLFIEDDTLPDTLWEAAKPAAAALLGASVVWFSAINAAVPLLVPILLLIAGGYGAIIAVHLKERGPRTLICDSNGDVVIDIPHMLVDTSERLGFEAGLKQQVETLDARWRDGDL